MQVYYFLNPYNPFTPLVHRVASDSDDATLVFQNKITNSAFFPDSGIVVYVHHLRTFGNICVFMTRYYYQGKFYPVSRHVGAGKTPSQIAAKLQQTILSTAVEFKESHILKGLDLQAAITNIWSAKTTEDESDAAEKLEKKSKDNSCKQTKQKPKKRKYEDDEEAEWRPSQEQEDEDEGDDEADEVTEHDDVKEAPSKNTRSASHDELDTKHVDARPKKRVRFDIRDEKKEAKVSSKRDIIEIDSEVQESVQPEVAEAASEPPHAPQPAIEPEPQPEVEPEPQLQPIEEKKKEEIKDMKESTELSEYAVTFKILEQNIQLHKQNRLGDLRRELSYINRWITSVEQRRSDAMRSIKDITVQLQKVNDQVSKNAMIASRAMFTQSRDQCSTELTELRGIREERSRDIADLMTR